MAKSLGGSFLPDADYDTTGDWTFTGDVTVTGTLTDSGSTLTSPVITGTVTGGASYTAPTLTTPALVTPTISGIALDSNTVTSATPSTTRYLQSSVTLTPATTISYSTGSLAAVRGDITLSAGKTMTDGFFYGTQGKFVGTTGTFNQSSAGRIAGVIGQVDLGTMTITAGQVSCVWADLQGSGPTLTSTEVNILRVTNSTAQTVNAMAFFYGQSTYFATMGRDGGTPTYFGNASDTTISKKLKINVGGTDYYIALTTSL